MRVLRSLLVTASAEAGSERFCQPIRALSGLTKLRRFSIQLTLSACGSMPPVGSTNTLMPVFVERTSGARCSTARKRVKLRCWCGSQVSPNQESFVRLTSTSGRLPPQTARMCSGRMPS